MPRYLIERAFDVTEEAMPEVATESHRIAVEDMPEIVWEHSHVLVDATGKVRTFCIYEAPDEEAVRRHAKALGKHRVEWIREIVDDVTPDDFPL